MSYDNLIEVTGRVNDLLNAGSDYIESFSLAVEQNERTAVR